MKMLRALFLASVLLWQVPAFAGTGTVTGKDATGATVTFATTTNAGAANIGQATVCDGTAAAQCAAVKAASTAAVATDPAMVVSVSPNNTIAATQSGTWNVGTVTTLSTVTNPIAATQSGNWTMRNVGNAGAILDFAGQNVASPANAFLMGGQFNTTPTTITTGNASPLQLDTNGNLLVNVKAGGAGGGAVTVADGADVTQGAKADAVCGTDTGSCSIAALIKRNNVIVDAPLQAQLGTVIIGGVGIAAQTSGGCTPGRLIVAGASTNGTAIKASAGTLCSVTITNQSTSAGQFRLQDATSATCSSATGVVANYPIQSNATSPGVTVQLGPFGQSFTTGISFCFTGFATPNVALDTDSTNFGGTTGNVVINYSFK